MTTEVTFVGLGAARWIKKTPCARPCLSLCSRRHQIHITLPPPRRNRRRRFGPPLLPRRSSRRHLEPPPPRGNSCLGPPPPRPCSGCLRSSSGRRHRLLLLTSLRGERPAGAAVAAARGSDPERHCGPHASPRTRSIQQLVAHQLLWAHQGNGFCYMWHVNVVYLLVSEHLHADHSPGCYYEILWF
jgi:hypothetical protein